MRKIFDEYGRMLVVVIAVVALIAMIAFTMRPNGVLANAFETITQTFADKTTNLISGDGDGGSGGSGGADELGFPIEWNSMEVVGNTSISMGGWNFVKVSEFTPSAAELGNTAITTAGETAGTAHIEDHDGAVMVGYGAFFTVFSVTVAGEYAELGMTFSEPGFYVMDMSAEGSLDFIIDVVTP